MKGIIYTSELRKINHLLVTARFTKVVNVIDNTVKVYNSISMAAIDLIICATLHKYNKFLLINI
jgi:hypothetical protein